MNANTQDFWKGDFGNEYAKRNVGRIEANVALFGRILAMTDGVQSFLELGCGTGQNLQALHALVPGASLDGVEINEGAASACKVGTIHNRSLLDFLGMVYPGPTDPAEHGLAAQFDLVFTKGVLIHQPPDELPTIYRGMYHATRRYVLLAEYYNPTPVEVPYRGHAGVLWKRDFAGEMLDTFPDLQLVDYGFAYHRGPFPQDDITWHLMEKR